MLLVVFHLALALHMVFGPWNEIPDLVRQLRSTEQQTRAKAADQLVDIALENPDLLTKYVPDIIPLLADTDFSTRLSASTALRRLGKRLNAHADKATPALVKALDDEEVSVAIQAARALEAMGKRAVPALAGCLATTKRPLVVIETLGGIGKDSLEALPAMAMVLRNGRDKAVAFQVRVADAIMAVDPENKDATAVLLLAVKNSDPEIRQVAAEAIANSQKLGHHGVSVLIETVGTKPDQINQIRSVVALWKIGGAAKASVPVLTDRLEKSIAKGDAFNGVLYASVIIRIESGHKGAIKVLRENVDDVEELLGSRDSLMRQIAVTAAGRAGLSSLERRMSEMAQKDESAIVRDAAREALSSFKKRKGGY
jgi:HEAT repeat protein